MNRTWGKALTAIMWLALPLVGLSYWQSWDRLPAQLATHFDAAGHANGWMSRENSLTLGLVVIGVMLLVFTIVLAQLQKSGISLWPMLGFSYLLTGIMVYAHESIVRYNLHGSPVHAWPVLIAVGVASAALLAGVLGSHRGGSLPSRTVLAEEVHASPAWGVILAVPAVVELAVAILSRNPGLRFGMGLGAVVLSLAALLAWSGFHYVFSNAGVEIKTFGLRLQSIPSGQIREYAAGHWNVWGGYGIRGLGNCRAYVWGNHGVRIKTNTGQVFLGHGEPQRLIHDLDAIKQVTY